MSERVTAAGIVQDYNRRGIKPDSTVEVRQGQLKLWIWCNQYIAELSINDLTIRGTGAYRNTLSPQDIADDLMAESQLTKPEIAMLSMSASTLGKIGGAAKTEAKQNASRENGKKGGRPRKEL
jgi:hypothetical protein